MNFISHMYVLTRVIPLIGLFYLVNGNLLAQNYLVLQKGTNQKSRITYEVGDAFIYLQEGNDYYIQDVIREINKDYIALKENVLSLKQIQAIDIRNKDERNQTLGSLTLLPIAGGTLLMLAGGINSLAQEGTIHYSKGVITTSAVLIGAGFLIKVFRYKKFKVGKKRKLMVITDVKLE